MTIRTRFAPSPTGTLHMGSARTALYAWLYARHHGGQFILRIEDTDLERSTQASIDAILDGMHWLGMDYDEGPYHQMERMDRYREIIDQLLESGHAYKCYCSKERLDELREAQMSAKQKPRYDGHCRHHQSKDADAPHVIRFKNPLEGQVDFADQVHGAISFNNDELDDVIILRTDGVPTYNLTVVVDDADMGITHVIRGDDHINNTPRQINIMRALGFAVPRYAHLPTILGSDGKRLSKRHGAVGVLEYREQGFLPEAMMSYLVRLGWSHGDQEIFSIEEMIQLFDVDHVNKAASHFDNEKLRWVNQHYLRSADPQRIATMLASQLRAMELSVDNGPELIAVVNAMSERAQTVAEMAEKSQYFFADDIDYDDDAQSQHLTDAVLAPFQHLREQFAACAWEEENLQPLIKDCANQFEMKLGKVAQPLRVALTGNTMSPSINTTAYLIGRERVLARLDRAITFIQGKSA